jgi:hypothetical protein
MVELYLYGFCPIHPVCCLMFFNLPQKSTKDPLLVPEESRNVDVHREGSVMDIHRE